MLLDGHALAYLMHTKVRWKELRVRKTVSSGTVLHQRFVRG